MSVAQFTEGEKEELKQAFELFDTNGDGRIDVKELKAAMEALGFTSRSTTVYKIFNEIDSNESGKIEFSEFLELVGRKIMEKDSKEEAYKIFLLFDKGNKGYISKEDLQDANEELGEGMDENAVMEMHKMIHQGSGDEEDRGGITFEEFYEIYSGEA
eukprot:snap_masked-scaffold_12-processed-gene-6.32-mRNA-1 protein AED:0.31 eAED:0.31 QI:0/-1/0/1/-1/1/1/0/156